MEVCFLDSANFALVGVAGESRLRGDHEHRTFTLPSRTCVFLQSTRLKAVWGSEGVGGGRGRGGRLHLLQLLWHATSSVPVLAHLPSHA